MNIYKWFFFIGCFLLQAAVAYPKELQPILSVDSQWALAEFLSIDARFPESLSKTDMNADDIGKRVRIEFQSDDGHQVNGMLAMPAERFSIAKLAVALHPMGADQSVWLRDGKPMFGGDITDHLRRRGYAVLTLDARWHGERKIEGIGPRQILSIAHSDNPRAYHQLIANTVRDYRLALAWAGKQSNLDASKVLALGYSMGAQMSLLLAAMEPNITAVLAMVPPYVGRAHSPVAPRNHVGRITEASVQLIAGRRDPYSSFEQTQQVFDAIASPAKDLAFLDSEHLLPETYVATALAFIDEKVLGAHP
ncbi:MAG: alpha/beta fold hydrolase [Gammaproteobacteria bacterium]|nr:alpha/beta fold hydrolase [Gammaproteobacteria bacterium]